jgi:uncharacterized protein with gpF-like domain
VSKGITSPTGKTVTLDPIRPNLGVDIAYQKKIDALIARMAAAVARAMLAVYRNNPPELAQDESSPAALRAAIGAMGKEWTLRFDEFAQHDAKRFVRSATGSADRAFAAALKKAGFTVEFKMGKAASEIITAAVAENVALIKSIPEQYLAQVEGVVMRGVAVGRDLGAVSADLQAQFGVTKRRAALIARDQNNKATAAITRARQLEVGSDEAEWVHSAGGRKPRPTHVANNNKKYNIAEGWLDPATDKRIWPGTEINCRCVSRTIIKGLK